MNDLLRGQSDRDAGTGPLVAVDDPQRWNAIVDGMPGAFLNQLWEWGEARATLGWEPHRLVFDPAGGPDGAPRAAMQVLVRRLPIVGVGVAHAPRGPLGARSPGDASALLDAVRAWARPRRIATVVVDPAVDGESELGRALQADPWSVAPSVAENRVHVLDLDPAIDPWLAVRRKHREWVRRGEKAGVDVTWYDADSSEADAERALAEFEVVYSELVERLRLVIHGPAFTARVWHSFRRAGRAQLAVASRSGAPVAAMLHITCANQMIWYAGGQAEAGAPFGAGKLLLWRAIARAHALGFRRYHMWGTATDSLAHYKEGYGAREERYIGTRAAALDRAGDRVVRAAWIGQRIALGIRHRRTASGRPQGSRRPAVSA